MSRIKLIAFGIFAVLATWFATVPQLTMLWARPLYKALAPNLLQPRPYAEWIANVIWTPIAGAPVVLSQGQGSFLFPISAIWSFFLSPIICSLPLIYLFKSSYMEEAEGNNSIVKRLILWLWIASLFLVVPIKPESTFERFYWWTSY